MKQIKTENAVGHVLCHDITQIIKGVTKDARFRKGHIISEADIPILLSMGKEHLFVFEQEQGMIHENDAAQILYEICARKESANMKPSEVKEGKIEVTANCKGLFKVDTKRLYRINALGEMMIATRHGNTPVNKGDKLAGTRVIPLMIHEDKLQKARKLAENSPILSVLQYKAQKCGIITTGSEVLKGRIKDTFTPVLQEKTSEFGADMLWHEVLGDDHEKITNAITAMAAKGADIVLVSGGMSVDPDDRTPLAIKNTGAKIISYGAPVLPGAMFLLAYYGERRVPVLGLPGCVMYAKRTIFDLVLPRVMACDDITAEELAALGHGGLCLNCENCVYPNCGFGKG